MKKLYLIICLIGFGIGLNAQELRVEPPFWYAGFKSDSLQLLVHYPNISQVKSIQLDSDHVKINQIHKADSPNYVFVDLNIPIGISAEKFKIDFIFSDNNSVAYTYELKPKQKPSEHFEGFDSSDAIYLITPDRFANGDLSNDQLPYLKEKKINRNDDYARHGGDIKGIIDHIDYIKNLGFTAVWPTPLLENDMPNASYHGYAITDYYKVDPRFGSLEDYKKLSSNLSKNNMKLIMDMVANHCGVEHWWMSDLPFKNWVNYQSTFEAGQSIPQSNHMRTTNQDTYASNYDSDLMREGWFVQTMPDLNQRNPFLATYIIQNSLWWIETLQLGGIRQDTYPYPDKAFMSKWAGAIMTEYPNFNIVGEEWSYNPLLVGYWQAGKQTKDGYQSNLKSTMDFPMQQAIVDALKDAEGWGSGLSKIYETLANDFHYDDPNSILVFPDNHDKSRIYTQLNENLKHTKMAVGLMLCLPRIPQLYYGTEILMNDTANPGDHGLIRTDFPGGWPDDEVSVFNNNGLTVAQQEMKTFTTKVLNYRKNSKAIHKGKTIHFAPFDGVYALFRIYNDEMVMILINKNESKKTIDLSRFKELNLAGKQFNSIHSKAQFEWDKAVKLNSGITIYTTLK